MSEHEAVALEYRPVDRDRWGDLEALFGPRGACGGCWCMAWRLQRRAFDAGKGERNRAALRDIVLAGECPGVLAYEGATPVGWCSVAPRERFPVLERSRALRRIDGEPVWSVTCLFVARRWRRRGVAAGLLEAAVALAATAGAAVVEGYPVEPRSAAMADVFAWTGTVGAFRTASFVEAARGPTGRPIMRRRLAPSRG
jgi:GNAT superfamily N-acetyltransferase